MQNLQLRKLKVMVKNTKDKISINFFIYLTSFEEMTDHNAGHTQYTYFGMEWKRDELTVALSKFMGYEAGKNWKQMFYKKNTGLEKYLLAD